jgi:hypothetical protein
MHRLPDCLAAACVFHSRAGTTVRLVHADTVAGSSIWWQNRSSRWQSTAPAVRALFNGKTAGLRNINAATQHVSGDCQLGTTHKMIDVPGRAVGGTPSTQWPPHSGLLDTPLGGGACIGQMSIAVTQRNM